MAKGNSKIVKLHLRRLLVPGLIIAAIVTVAVAHNLHNDSVKAAALPVTVMELGDSITRGLDNTTPIAWAEQGGYRTLLWQKTVVQDKDNIDFVGSLSSGPTTLGDKDHEGHSGNRIDELQASIDGWMASYHPQIILLHIGTNDIMQNYDVANAPSRLATLVKSICTDDPGVQVAVAQIIPRPGLDSTVQTYNAAIPGALSSLPASCHYEVVNMHTALSATIGNNQIDDISTDATHPLTPASLTENRGYNKLALAWYPVLTNLYNIVEGNPPSPPTAQPGLTGSYFANTTLAGTATVSRVDPQVHFSWGTSSPASGVPASQFSVRWTGVLLPPTSGNYTIGTQSQNGVRASVNGTQVINDWTAHSSKWDTAPMSLTAGQRVPVTIEYYASSGSAVMNLSWSGPSISWGTLAGQYLATQ